ncbi:hypothetical protein AMTRI_Chr05g70270 [Amborella trichopoda]
MVERQSRDNVIFKLSLGFIFMMNFIKISHIFPRTIRLRRIIKNYQIAPISGLRQMSLYGDLGSEFFFILFHFLFRNHLLLTLGHLALGKLLSPAFFLNLARALL